MKMYHILASVDMEESVLADKYSIMEGMMKRYSKLKKKGKTHRSVLDRNKLDVYEIEQSFPLGTTSSMSSRRKNEETSIDVKTEVINMILDKMHTI